MGTYIPMEDAQRNGNAATMLYLRDPLPNSQSQPLLPGGLVYMNFSSSASAGASMSFSDAYSDSGGPQQVLLNFGSGRGVDGHLMVGGDSGVVHSLQGQGLSLSLATNVMQMAPVQYPSGAPDFISILGGSGALMPGEERTRSMSFENEDGFHCRQAREGDYVLSSGLGSSSDVLPAYGMPRGVLNSKYLKAAQELLDEVVNVKQQNARKKDAADVEGEAQPRDEAADPSTKDLPSEFSVAEKHELQNKLTKLLSMLDEVDRRYRQYYHQMQIVVSSFDVVAGNGASRPYTALALQTISRHFRCLRDAINNQIQRARKSLGEDDASSNNKGVGISRLRYVDQQLRQQRALQQLGMMQQHAWRPQRGLPESSVSILRAWLFEHFLHPYPKDSDKIMLARQTGLTRSQVSNWFINARVRLWKPMVEEMYKEEAGDADMDSNSSSETTTRAAKTPTKPSEDLQQSETYPGSRSDQMAAEMMESETSSTILHNMSGYSAGRGRDGVQKQMDNSNAFPDGMMESSSGNERFLAAYHMSEIERFGNTGGVSLTLGLQHEAMAEGSQDGFAPLRDSDMYNASAAAAAASDMGGETAEFDCMDSGSRPHQFVSSLLPSFS